ncbi:MAG: DUF721 domain-containing protein [Bacteroidales bacterium]|nr:DUF721 domain-containing protein [Bacteroidales bacterium]MCF8405072.1 DUF721 domain-containing protein [Bacteroidales bacterium]
MYSSNEQTLKEAIKKLLDAYKLNDGIMEARVMNNWEKIAGSYIAKFTESVHIKKRTLYIKLSSPAVKHELSFAKSKLITSLNNSVKHDAIDEIVFL